jgi:hypothetical protein
MSLSSHLDDRHSPVRAFLESQFPNVSAVVQQCKQKLAGIEIIKPLTAIPPHAYRLIGTAFDYRTRYYFEDYPSYDTVAFKGGVKLFIYSVCDAPGGVDDPESIYPLLWEFFGSAILGVGDDSETGLADSTIGELQPAKRRLEPEQEKVLARYCCGLAYFEQIFRRGIQANTPILQPKPLRSVEALLDLPENAWVDDLCALSWAFHDDFNHLFASKGETLLNPKFEGSRDIGGADADLIVDGCLIDLKVVTQLHLDSYIYQILGYALLDYNDKYKIREVALYLARHRALLKWTLDELLSKVSDGKALPVEALRGQFREVLNTLDEQDTESAKPA